MTATQQGILVDLTRVLKGTVTTWPIEPVYTCRDCNASFAADGTVAHRPRCVVARLTEEFAGAPGPVVDSLGVDRTALMTPIEAADWLLQIDLTGYRTSIKVAVSFAVTVLRRLAAQPVGPTKAKKP